MNALLQFDQVDAGYGSVKILKDLSFEVFEGEILGVIGPNGCGKTTMFNALIGLIPVMKGNIRFKGHDVHQLPAATRCRQGMGRTYQVPRPFEHMTVFENVLVAVVHGAGLSERQGRHVCREALELTGLSDKREIMAGTLTLLDRKRLEIARSLGSKPTLLMLDEVAAGLTDAEVRDVMRLVADLKAAGQTIIWIEHVIETMVKATDRLMCMSDGQALMIGEPRAVMYCKEVGECYLGAEETSE